MYPLPAAGSPLPSHTYTNRLGLHHTQTLPTDILMVRDRLSHHQLKFCFIHDQPRATHNVKDTCKREALALSSRKDSVAV